jgi:hypothetical protein
MNGCAVLVVLAAARRERACGRARPVLTPVDAHHKVHIRRAAFNLLIVSSSLVPSMSSTLGEQPSASSLLHPSLSSNRGTATGAGSGQPGASVSTTGLPGSSSFRRIRSPCSSSIIMLLEWIFQTQIWNSYSAMALLFSVKWTRPGRLSGSPRSPDRPSRHAPPPGTQPPPSCRYQSWKRRTAAPTVKQPGPRRTVRGAFIPGSGTQRCRLRLFESGNLALQVPKDRNAIHFAIATGTRTESPLD